MQSQNIISVLASAAILIALPAYAADDNSGPGLYAGFGLGASTIDVTSSPTTVGHESNGGALKIYGGYQFNETFGTELGYVRTGRIKVTESIDDIDVTRTVKTRAAYIVVTGRLPISESFQVLGRLGMSYGDVNVGDVAPIPNTVDGSRKSIMIGASVRYRLSDRYSLSLDYDRIGKESSRVSADTLTMTIVRRF